MILCMPILVPFSYHESCFTSLGLWGMLERGECTSAEFKDLFEKSAAKKFGRHLPEEIVTKIGYGGFPLKICLEMMDTVQCLRAEGIKTAVLTNNWFLSEGESLFPLDRSLFNVVCTDLSLQMKVVYYCYRIAFFNCMTSKLLPSAQKLRILDCRV